MNISIAILKETGIWKEEVEKQREFVHLATRK